MPKRRVGILSDLPVKDLRTGDILAVIETPKGSRNKYAFDPDLNAFRLTSILPNGNIFPFDFGFIPSTRADDGDPVDLLVLLDDSVPPGCVLTVRIVGAIEAEQKKENEKWVRNDRLIAVATHAHLHKDVKSLKDLNPYLLEEIEAFFVHYNTMEGREFRVVHRCGPKAATRLIDGAKRV